MKVSFWFVNHHSHVALSYLHMCGEHNTMAPGTSINFILTIDLGLFIWINKIGRKYYKMKKIDWIKNLNEFVETQWINSIMSLCNNYKKLGLFSATIYVTWILNLHWKNMKNVMKYSPHHKWNGIGKKKNWNMRELYIQSP